MRVPDVRRRDVAELHHGLRAKPSQANRTLSVLSRMFPLAEIWGWRPDGANPSGRQALQGTQARAVPVRGGDGAASREDGNPWVIAGRPAGTHLADLQGPWRRIRARRTGRRAHS